jgi:endoplasmic reticulum Man9GlcNAc2 1,2-alpha-mannosidase
MGWVIIDALDTMMLMNLTEEIERARSWIVESLDWDQDREVSLFETTIRMLGGLLSAHYISGYDDVYLEKAVDLADRLLGGFDSPTGIPYASVNLKYRTGHQSYADGGASTTSEVSTLQLEFKYLAKLTGETLYWEKAEKVIEALESNKAQDGLVPIFVHPESGSSKQDVTHSRSLHHLRNSSWFQGGFILWYGLMPSFYSLENIC